MQRRKAEAAGYSTGHGAVTTSLHKTGQGHVKCKLSTVMALAVVIPAMAMVLMLYLSLTVSPPVTTTTSHPRPGKSDQGATPQVSSPVANDQAKNRESTLNRRAETAKAVTPKGDAESPSVEYHIIFSTGCSTFQDWQSYVFFYYAMISGQPGTVTRIVSGCNEEDENTLQKIFDEQIRPMSPHFKIHFTPDFSNIKPSAPNYKYFNKPFGTKHWLENALGFPDNPQNEDAIVILMDPDQIIIRPFTNNDFSNTEWKYAKENPRTRIEHGKPMGQLYGFYIQWKQKVNMTIALPNEKSPIDDMTDKEAREGYVVGPPYIATARDMYKIAVKWCEFAIPVHDQYPHLLAEMFAYCIGAAHQKLAHQIAVSFMVSDVGSGKGEGWNYIDRIPAEEVCRERDPADYPNVVHFCQRYALGRWFFGKYKQPHDFLSCEHPLLKEPPDTIATELLYAEYPDKSKKKMTETTAKRNAFMLCQMIPAVNKAATYYKQNHCDDNANYDKTFTFHKN